MCSASVQSRISMKLPALRRQLAQQVGEVNQVLGDQVANLASVDFTLTAQMTCDISATSATQITLITR